MYCVDHIFSKAYKKKEIETLEKAGAKNIYITSLFEENYCRINTKIHLNAKTTEECDAQLYDGAWRITRRNNQLYTIEDICQRIKENRENKIMKTTIGKLKRNR